MQHRRQLGSKRLRQIPAALKLIEVGPRHDRLRGPLNRELLLRVEDAAPVGPCRRCDLALAQELTGGQRKNVEPTRDYR